MGGPVQDIYSISLSPVFIWFLFFNKMFANSLVSSLKTPGGKKEKIVDYLNLSSELRKDEVVCCYTFVVY